MIYELPPLPYGINDLAPVISQETIEYHYGKHEQTYIDNLNKLIEGTPFADKPLEEIIKEADGALFNNASQVWNHIFYFFTFSPNGKKSPQGKLAEAINKKWGNFENFQKEFEQAGTTLFGSGWVWLSKDKDGNLVISKENNAGSPLTKGLTPLLTFDVWEHAYYIDYRNRRADFIKSYWELIDWDKVADRIFPRKYHCTACDYVYDPAKGDPESGIAPGTAFEDIPDDWVCPVCGLYKDSFKIVEEK